jgi:hypothetical protein
MAHTTTILNRLKFNDATMVIAAISGISGVPSGGEPITAAELGLATIDEIISSGAGGTTVFGVRPVRANPWTLAFFQTSDAGTAVVGALPQATGTLSGTTAVIAAIGK